jgi:hypothetical protein
MAGALTISTLNNDTGVLATQNGMTGIPKAWVNFNGTGTVAIRSSFNVSSITDNGTGDYTVNFTTAMPNTNFDVNGTCSNIVNNCPTVYDNSPTRARTTSSVSVRTMDTVNFGDPVWVNVSVFSS